MGGPDPAHPSPAREQGVLLQRLLPPAAAATAEQAVEALGLHLGPGELGGDRARTHVLLNVVTTADGHAAIDGRSGPIGNRADREVFLALRDVVDAVMAGAGTVRAERYGRLIRDEGRRRLRRERGLSEEPLACIVSGRLALPADLPLLADPHARVVIVTASQATLPDSAADVSYVRAGHDGVLDLRAALAQLRRDFGVRTLLCEGGPHLNLQLLAAGLVEELHLSLAPKLAGGSSEAGQMLGILAGGVFATPAQLQLLSVWEYDSQLLLRYRVLPSPVEMVSRETTPSSSLVS